jgi:tungstate transport system substrate-binding protein
VKHLIVAAALLLLSGAAQAESIVLASTTSVDNSGLLAKILPVFTAQTGIEVKVIAQGTGQALATAAHGDADLVLVHDPDAEARFIEAGHGLKPVEIAWNDFLFVGPKSDPAHIAGGHDAIAALHAIAASATSFVTRGDKSGTDAAEKRLWKKAGIDPQGQGWYRDIGGGMGAALNTAAAMDAVLLTDRGTWLSFQNKRDLVPLVERDPAFINRYDVIELNPASHANAKLELAHKLAAWLAGPEGQREIGTVVMGGEQLFHPDAGQPYRP